jgi:peptidoglycan/LPS O-acetylase OafA/YrhL
LQIVTGSTINWYSWIGNLFSLQGVFCGPIIGPLWSLTYEVWAYIFFGGVAAIFASRTSIRRIAYVFVFIVFCVFIKLEITYLFIWLMGAFAYKLMPTRFNKYIALISAMISFCCIVLLQLSSGSHAFDTSVAPEVYKLIELIFAFSFCAFVQQIVLKEPQNWISIKINVIGSSLAAFSYTLYLVHPIIERTLEHFNAPKFATIDLSSLGLYSLWILLGLCLSYLVYLCFERNTVYCKHKIKAFISKNLAVR